MKLSTYHRFPLHQLFSMLVLTLLGLIMTGHVAFAGSERGTIGPGLASSANCLLADTPSAQLFHSLCPHIWRTDGGTSNQQLIGKWSSFEGTAAISYVFYANGRYGKSSQAGYDGQVRNFEQQGRYRLQGNELVVRPDNSDLPTMQYQISWHEERNQNGWIRSMTLHGNLFGRGFEEHYAYEGQP